jgi:hypothetical protein
MSRRLTDEQLRELRAYVKQYKARGIIGVWWDLAEAIETALNEIEDHRKPFPFKHGMRVGLKKPERRRARWGRIVSFPRRGSRLVHVRWPDGWAGWVATKDLIVDNGRADIHPRTKRH